MGWGGIRVLIQSSTPGPPMGRRTVVLSLGQIEQRGSWRDCTEFRWNFVRRHKKAGLARLSRANRHTDRLYKVYRLFGKEAQGGGGGAGPAGARGPLGPWPSFFLVRKKF